MERGFAWGWLTHVAADVAIHPVVNDCARRVVAALGGNPADALELAVAHSRLELGLDVRVEPATRACAASGSRTRSTHARWTGTDTGYATFPAVPGLPPAPARAAPLVAAYEGTAASFWATMRRFQLDGLRALGEPDLDGNATPVLLSA